MINIAYCFDRNYRQHFAVSLCSLLKNHNDDENIHVHIVTDEIDEEFVRKIESIDDAKKTQFSWLCIDKNKLAKIPLAQGTHFSKAIYYRLFLSFMIDEKVEKILYLDSDTVCLNSVSELFKSNMHDKVAAGVLDNNNLEERSRLGVDIYLNSGVLLIDLKRWRETKFSEKCFEWLQGKPDINLGDQDAINFIGSGNIMQLDDKWNVQIDPNRLHLVKGAENVKILHYISHLKPWQLWYDDQLGKQYNLYLAQTPWASSPKIQPQKLNEYLELCRKLVREEKYSDAIICYESIISDLSKQLLTISKN